MAGPKDQILWSSQHLIPPHPGRCWEYAPLSLSWGRRQRGAPFHTFSPTQTVAYTDLNLGKWRNEILRFNLNLSHHRVPTWTLQATFSLCLVWNTLKPQRSETSVFLCTDPHPCSIQEGLADPSHLIPRPLGLVDASQPNHYSTAK